MFKFLIFTLVTMIVVPISNAQVDTITLNKYTYSYDKDGFQSDTLHLGTLWYNADSMLLKDSFNYAINDVSNIVVTYFNNIGKKSRRINIYNNELISDSYFEYDSLGNMLKQDIHNANDIDINIMHVNTYNADGKILKSVMKQNEMPYNIESFVTYLYDKKGNKILEKSIVNDVVVYLYKFKYDSVGRMIEKDLEESIFGATEYVKLKYFYNANNSISKTVEKIKQKGTITNEYKWNGKLILSETLKQSDGSTTVFLYR